MKTFKQQNNSWSVQVTIKEQVDRYSWYEWASSPNGETLPEEKRKIPFTPAVVHAFTRDILQAFIP
jgi:hypothetical protein